MVKFNELKVGDYVIVNYEGEMWEGEVVNLNNDEKQVCVRTSVQEFYYEPKDIFPITLDEQQLFKLGFQKQELENGEIKYMKGAFRVLIHRPGDFSNFEIWYREDRRHISSPIYVHELQNHYYLMTKVHLTSATIS